MPILRYLVYFNGKGGDDDADNCGSHLQVLQCYFLSIGKRLFIPFLHLQTLVIRPFGLLLRVRILKFNYIKVKAYGTNGQAFG